MSMRNAICVAVATTLLLADATFGSDTNARTDGVFTKRAGPDLGRPISEAQAAAYDLTVAPDGRTLPPGRGSVPRGGIVYAQLCRACHGTQGAVGVGGIPRLTGGVGSLTSDKPIKTVNSFWPQAPGVFDYIRRAMPPTAPQSLSADDIYAVTAYLLSIDGIVSSNAALDAKSLPKVKMPNRDGFVSWWLNP
jgi:cytochrome c